MKARVSFTLLFVGALYNFSETRRLRESVSDVLFVRVVLDLLPAVATLPPDFLCALFTFAADDFFALDEAEATPGSVGLAARAPVPPHQSMQSDNAATRYNLLVSIQLNSNIHPAQAQLPKVLLGWTLPSLTLKPRVQRRVASRHSGTISDTLRWRLSDSSQEKQAVCPPLLDHIAYKLVLRDLS